MNTDELYNRLNAENAPRDHGRTNAERLMFAVLENAIREANGAVSGSYRRADWLEAAVADAQAWLLSDDVSVMSAVHICDALDLDLSEIRRHARAQWAQRRAA